MPVGTVTFLLADVEGSTRAWEADGPETAEAMHRLEEVADGAVSRHGGVRPLEQGEGDSFVAAFARASEAIAAALEIQIESQRDGLPRLRLGLHTGEAQLRDDTRYFGQTIIRAARLRDLGHGGQVLLSRACVDVGADHLPPWAGVEDLGSHRMRDLTRPERVFQLTHPDLARVFPPLRSLDRHPHNLPVQLTSFIGRETAIRECADLLVEHRLVTLTGSGGCGKTRLALQIAAEQLPGLADGAWFIDLSGLRDASLVPDAVMAAVGIREVSSQPHIETVVSHLSGAAALLLFDNCEHVLSGAAALADRIVRQCPQMLVLATSREALSLAGEVTWRVPCLTVPAEARPVDVAQLDVSEAVRLFIDRARAARPNFAITEENAPAVAAVCQRLDGIPLAIELAAARVRMMSPEAIAAALSDRFHLLTGGSRTALPRQQTLRASVDWSYQLLTVAERVLLRRLSVFAGGFGLDAAELVGAGGDIGRYDVVGHLGSLVDKSLVQVNDAGDRYRLLETIRAYAGAELAASGEEGDTRDRHLGYFAELAERAEAGMWTEAATTWMAILSAEHDNLRACLDWAMASGDYDTGARTLYGISTFLYTRALRREGLDRYEAFLAQDICPARRAELLWHCASFAFYSDPSAAYQYGDDLTELGRQIGDPVAVARGLAQRSAVKAFVDPRGALADLEEARALARANGDEVTVVDSYCFESVAHLTRGEFTAALESAESALGTAVHMGWPWGIGFANSLAGSAACLLGRLDRAVAAAGVLEHLSSELDDPWFSQGAHHLRGTAGIYRADPSAPGHLAEARRIAETTGDHVNVLSIRTDQAVYAAAHDDDDEAAVILDETVPLADALLPVIGIVARALLAEIAIRQGDLARARERIDAASALKGGEGAPLVMRGQAKLARARGDVLFAWERACHGLEAALQSDDSLRAVDFLEICGHLAADAERHKDAARLLGTAAAQREHLGYRRFPSDQPDWQSTLDVVDGALGVEERTRSWEEGTNLTAREALEYIRRGRGQRNRPSTGWASLTPTERRVVDLVLDGLSNADIGRRMFVSTVTVKSHLTHVFQKVGVSSRVELRSVAKVLTR